MTCVKRDKSAKGNLCHFASEVILNRGVLEINRFQKRKETSLGCKRQALRSLAIFGDKTPCGSSGILKPVACSYKKVQSPLVPLSYQGYCQCSELQAELR